jgi:hypothetical protein
LRRFSFFEKTGDRWWPITGGVYYLRATKKVLGMRILAPAWERRERRKKALAPAARAREGLTTHRAPVESLAPASCGRSPVQRRTCR